jgi:hypothetical protein
LFKNDCDDVEWMKMNAMKTSRARWRASTERCRGLKSNRALASGSIGTAAAAAEKKEESMQKAMGKNGAMQSGDERGREKG